MTQGPEATEPGSSPQPVEGPRIPNHTFLGKEDKPVYLTREIGAGIYARVFQANYDDPQDQAAVKVAHYGKNLEGSALNDLEREQAAGSAAGEVDYEFAGEAEALQALAAGGSSYTPTVHYYHRGYGPNKEENPSYITMDLARGKLQDIATFIAHASTNPQSFLAMMSQVVATVELGHKVGFVYFEDKNINWQIIWDEGNQHATLIDWGHAKKANPRYEDNFETSYRKLLLHIASVISDATFSTPLEQSGQLFKGLDDFVKKDSINIALEADEAGVTLSSTTARMARSDQIYPLIMRILDQQDLAAVPAEIGRLRRTHHFETSQDQPFEIPQRAELNKLFPEIGDSYHARGAIMNELLKTVKPEDSSVTAQLEAVRQYGVKNLDEFWTVVGNTISHFIHLREIGAKENPSTLYMEFIRDVEKSLQKSNIPGLEQSNRFILGVLKYMQAQASVPAAHEAGKALPVRDVGALCWDIILLSIRPDIATTGNRKRLAEALDKLGGFVDISAFEGADEIRKLTEAPAQRKIDRELLIEQLMADPAKLEMYHKVAMAYSAARAGRAQAAGPAVGKAAEPVAAPPVDVGRQANTPPAQAVEAAVTSSELGDKLPREYHEPWAKLFGEAEKIGEGLDAFVFRPVKFPDAVIKEYKKPGKLHDEFKPLKALQGLPCVPILIGYNYHSSPAGYIVEEFISGENMMDASAKGLLRLLQPPVTHPSSEERKLATWLTSSMQALAMIHERDFVIRDFKFSDWPWDQSKQSTVIIDFGNSEYTWYVSTSSNREAYQYQDINEILKVFFFATELGSKSGLELNRYSGTVELASGVNMKQVISYLSEITTGGNSFESLKRLLQMAQDFQSFSKDKRPAAKDFAQAFKDYFTEVGLMT